jgi:hypothetical protein
VFEAVATFLFLVCILGVTQKGAPAQFAGLAIGLIDGDPQRRDQRDWRVSEPRLLARAGAGRRWLQSAALASSGSSSSHR